MSGNRILIVYASAFGSTAEVAGALATELCRGGAVVDVRAVVDVSELDPYSAVVVASPIYNGAWLPEAQYFVRHYAAELSRRAVAYVVVSATMRWDTPRRRGGVLSFLDPVLQDVPAVRPVAIGLFAGRIDVHRLPWWVRLRLRLTTGLRHGDNRDWIAITQWASNVLPLLMAPPTAP
jgi:menaquinone-dependent protoporphyrinogen oxidase